MDIHEYRNQLAQKLAQVDAIIAEMGGTAAAPKRRGRKPKASADAGPARKGKRNMSAAGRAAIAAAARARWQKAKAAGKSHL